MRGPNKPKNQQQTKQQPKTKDSVRSDPSDLPSSPSNFDEHRDRRFSIASTITTSSTSSYESDGSFADIPPAVATTEHVELPIPPSLPLSSGLDSSLNLNGGPDRTKRRTPLPSLHLESIPRGFSFIPPSNHPSTPQPQSSHAMAYELEAARRASLPASLPAYLLDSYNRAWHGASEYLYHHGLNGHHHAPSQADIDAGEMLRYVFVFSVLLVITILTKGVRQTLEAYSFGSGAYHSPYHERASHDLSWGLHDETREESSETPPIAKTAGEIGM